MSIVIDAVSDIFLCIADMVFARKSDEDARAKREKGTERETEKEGRRGQSR